MRSPGSTAIRRGAIYIEPGNSQLGSCSQIGAANKVVVVHFNVGTSLTVSSNSLTLTSGSSLVGDGQGDSFLQSAIQCRINSSTPCIVTTTDYESQGYFNGTRIENLLIECSMTGCSEGLQDPGLGLGATINNVRIDQAAAECWYVKDTGPWDWTEAVNVQNFILTSCGADGLDIDVSAGGFFNDITFTNFQVRGQKGYQIKAVSGSSGSLSVSRLVFNAFHGSTGNSPAVQDGVFCQNGGGLNSISDWAFNGSEIEGSSQTGYPINGNQIAACAHFQMTGASENGFASYTASPNVQYDYWCGVGTGQCSFGLPYSFFDASNSTGVRVSIPSSYFQGAIVDLSLPPYSSTPASLSDIVYTTVFNSTDQSIDPTTMAIAGGTGNTYRVSFYADITAPGAGCSDNSRLTVNITFTDPNSSESTTRAYYSGTIAQNGNVGSVILSEGGAIFRAKATTNVQYGTIFTPASDCVLPPSYQLYPILELLN